MASFELVPLLTGPLLGGALIGLAASLVLLGNGRIAGISGIVGSLLSAGREKGWQVAFLVGLVLSGAIFAGLSPNSFAAPPRALWVLALAGLLVGFGTRIGNGCTSGHGVCGISRLSTRSLVATAAFMAAAIVTVLVLRLLGVPSS
jgi:uncharacterized membrane protein YedE/YeeE